MIRMTTGIIYICYPQSSLRCPPWWIWEGRLRRSLNSVGITAPRMSSTMSWWAWRMTTKLCQGSSNTTTHALSPILTSSRTMGQHTGTPWRRCRSSASSTRRSGTTPMTTSTPLRPWAEQYILHQVLSQTVPHTYQYQIHLVHWQSYHAGDRHLGQFH